MRYAQIRSMDISNGEGIGVALFTQGCPIRCPGCFQPETGDFDGGQEFNADTCKKLYEILDQPYINRFSILGGEPLSPHDSFTNLRELFPLLYYIKNKYPNIKIWLYTGYEYSFLQKQITPEPNEFGYVYPTRGGYYLNKVLNNIDYLVAGPFIQEEKDLTLKGCGSRNQEVIDMNKTKETGYKVVIK